MIDQSGSTEEIKKLIEETLVFEKSIEYYQDKLERLCSLLCKCADHPNHPRLPILQICITHATSQIQGILNANQAAAEERRHRWAQVIAVICVCLSVVSAAIIG